MPRIRVSTNGTILDSFDLQSVEHMAVFKPFDVVEMAQWASHEIEIHTEHLGVIPKSGRILEVYCVEPESRKCSAHFYNADSVVMGPEL